MEKPLSGVRGRPYRLQRPPALSEMPVENALGHVLPIGTHKSAPADTGLIDGLRGLFADECAQVGMAMAMSGKADQDGFAEIADAYRRIALNETEHAAKLAQLLGEDFGMDLKSDLSARVRLENGDIRDKLDLAERAKTLGYDSVHRAMHDMARDEARHSCAYMGLLKEYFDC